MKKLIIGFAGLCFFSTVFCSSQDTSTTRAHAVSFLASNVYSENSDLISDAECQNLLPNKWMPLTEKLSTETWISNINSENFNINNLTYIYRDKATEPNNTVDSKVTYIHVREGILNFQFKGKHIITPVIVSSIFDKGGKPSSLSLQSLYCSARMTIKKSP